MHHTAVRLRSPTQHLALSQQSTLPTERLSDTTPLLGIRLG